MAENKDVTFVNPITGKPVDELITEAEAVMRGYLTFEFMMRHLEDENESVKYFVVDDKKILVTLAKPMTHYKEKPTLNHARIFGETSSYGSTDSVRPVLSSTPSPTVCVMDEGCVSCSG